MAQPPLLDESGDAPSSLRMAGDVAEAVETEAPSKAGAAEAWSP